MNAPSWMSDNGNVSRTRSVAKRLNKDAAAPPTRSSPLEGFSSDKYYSRAGGKTRNNVKYRPSKSSLPTGNRILEGTDPLECDLFYRGCDEDDVENIMDVYTGTPHLETVSDLKRPQRRARQRPHDDTEEDVLEPVNAGFVGFDDDKGFGSYAANYDTDFVNAVPNTPIDDYDGTDDSGLLSFMDGHDDDRERHMERERDREIERERERAREREREREREADLERKREREQRTHGISSIPRAAPASITEGALIRRPPLTDTDAGQYPPSSYPSTSSPISTSYAIEIALYVLTGIVLIFVMEQFVQIGIHIGGSAVASRSAGFMR